MIKKIALIVSISLVFLYADDFKGSFDRGQTYYKYLIKPHLGYSGETFVAKYTQMEWKVLFENRGELFKKEFGINKELKELFDSEKFERMVPHLKAFAIHYAKDSGYSPHCGNNVIDD
jgi:hypothetical protein